MLDRRAFLCRTSIALAGGLVLGDEVLEQFARLTHRPVFALGGLPETATSILERRLSYQVLLNKQMEIVTRKLGAGFYDITVPSDHALLGILQVERGDAVDFTVKADHRMPPHTIAIQPVHGTVVHGRASA